MPESEWCGMVGCPGCGETWDCECDAQAERDYDAERDRFHSNPNV